MNRYPLLIAGHADEQLAVPGRFEHVVDRPGAVAGGHWRRLLTGGGNAGHRDRHQECGTFEQRAADALALAGGGALMQRRLGGIDTEGGTENVDD